MTDDTGVPNLVLKSDRPKADMRVSETSWGYIVQKSKASRQTSAWGELAATTGCIFFGFMAYCQWLLPGSSNFYDVVPLKIAVTIMFFVFSGLMYLTARRGLASEVHIDVNDKKLRLVRRNRGGEATQMGAVPFQHIRSVFMKRSKSAGEQDRLYIQGLRGGPALIAKGPASALDPLRERIQSDTRTTTKKSIVDKVAEKVQRPRTSAFAAR